MEKIQIHALVTDGLQTRVTLNEDVVADYCETLREGGSLPPVVVFRDVLTDYLADGFHRLEAAKRLGRIDIEAEVYDGDRTAALRYALKANAAHGLRRTNEDKRNALRIAWDNRQALFGGDPSNPMLAEACGVTKPTVIKWRKMFTGSKTFTPCSRVGADGKTYKVSSTKPNPAAETAEKGAVDRFGMPVPKAMGRVFDARETKRMSRLIRKMAKRIEQAQKNGEYAFSRISQSTLVTLRNAAADIRLEMPWCVCRHCHGEGCRACGRVGVQTKQEYDLNPSEKKA